MSYKKIITIIACLLLCIFTGCTTKNKIVPEEEKLVQEKAECILPDTENWVHLLENEGSLTVDLDGDLKEDTIELTYENLEGEQYIKDFYVNINGKKISLYDDANNIDVQKNMTLQEIVACDFKDDGKIEYVFLFDTHGSGGNGSHKAWILWLDGKEHFEILDCLDYYEEGERDKEGGLDTLYMIQHVEEDNSKLKTYQYSYLEGRSDYNGDVVSIIGYDMNEKRVVVLDTWKEYN